MIMQISWKHWFKERQSLLAMLVLGVVIGVLCVLSARLFHHDPGFKGIELHAYDAEVHYTARVKEVMEGHLRLGNVFLPNKDLPYALPVLPELVVGGVGALLSITAVQAVQVSQFVLGFLVFIFFVRFISLFVKHRSVALITVFGMMCAGFLIGEPQWIWRIMTQGFVPSEGLLFGRPINPAWSVLFTLIGLYHAVRWYDEQKRRSLWMGALACVVLIYSYIYGWTIVLTAGVGIGVLSVARHRRLPWKDLLIVAGTSVILVLPYLYNLRRLTHDVRYPALTMRFGVLSSYAPILNFTAVAALIVFFCLCRGAWARYRWVLLWLAASWLIVLNQQLITGHVIQTGHYHWYFIRPFASALIGALLLDRLYSWAYPRAPRLTMAVMVTGCLIAMLIGGARQYAFYKTYRTDAYAEQSFAGALSFLRANAKADEVVYAPLDLSDLIPMYTETNVYQASNSVGYLISTPALAERYFFDLWIRYGDAYQPDWSDRQTLCELSSRLYAVYYGHLVGDCAALPAADINHWRAAFSVYQAQSPEAKLTFHRVDDIVLRTNKPEGIWLRYAQKIYQDDWYTIYRIHPPSPPSP